MEDKQFERKMRRMFLEPLTPTQRTRGKKELRASLKHIENLAYGIKNYDKTKAYVLKEKANTKEKIDFINTLYSARRISRQQYVFFISRHIEEIHEDRMFEDYYPEIVQINKKITALKKKHGLREDEDWYLENAPKEYIQLSDQWDKIDDQKFYDLLKEYDVLEMALLFKNNIQEYDLLRERGRRSVFHKDEIRHILIDIIKKYEDDAHRSASIKAYTSAILALASALEAILLLRCIKSKTKAVKIANALKGKSKPSKNIIDDPTKWTFETLIDVCLHAKWLPQVTTAETEYTSGELAHFLRKTRNFIHPGKMVRERAWLEIEQREYLDAEAIYTAIATKLG